MPHRPDERLALFQPRFLSISMTFIYRQLLGVADAYRPLVMTNQLVNQEHFPYDRVLIRRKSAVEFWYATAMRKAFGRYLPMSARRRSHWERVLRSNNIRLIHAHFGYSGLEVLPLARALDIPLLVTFHGADASNMLRSRHYVRDLQELFDYANVITVSEIMAQRLEGIGASRDRMTVHYIGAPVDDFAFVERRPVSEKARAGEVIVFLQVANFVEKKGHCYTIEAFARLARRSPNCRLVLAGGGPLRDACIRRAAELGVADRVEFPGPVIKSEVIDLMGRADIFVHHSVTARNGSQEGLPTVLMEAMATGLPVVSTVHAGIPELVKDGVNGYLLEERDVAGYADKLEEAMQAPLAMPGEAAQTVRRNFNLDVQNEKLKTIYARLMGRPQA